MTAPPPLLEARGLTMDFPGVRALDGVDFTLRAGEVHALMGENGAGKSTLIKILSGLHAPTAGTIALHGRTLALRSPRDAEAAGVSTVYQEIDLIPTLSVADNIALGRPGAHVRGPGCREAGRDLPGDCGDDSVPLSRG